MNSPVFPLDTINYDQFRASSRPQIFSIPESIVFYMAKNPSTPALYQKLIQSCKYFFIKTPILVFHCLHFDAEDGGWNICIHETCRNKENQRCQNFNCDLEKVQSKIWVTHSLQICCFTPTFTSSLISKFYKCDAKILVLGYQFLSFNEFLVLTPELRQLILEESVIFYEDNTVVPCEIIVANLPYLTYFHYNFSIFVSYDFSNTVSNLLKIPHFKNLKYLNFYGVTESFDIDKFWKYLKETTQTKVYMKYLKSVSEEYKHKLQAICDEILDAETPRKYRPPYNPRLYFANASSLHFTPFHFTSLHFSSLLHSEKKFFYSFSLLFYDS